MRTAFADTVRLLARDDPRVYLLTGDVGFGVFEPFAEEFPDRYINVGVAEANLAGVAAGLALSGKRPFIYSIGNFPTLRCLEQVRNDICYNAANVKIVSVGGGLSYGQLGATHHATEDLAVMRALPGMTVIAPADPVETALAVRAAYEHPDPVYLRLNRAGDPVVHRTAPEFRLGQAISVRSGNDVTLIACGGIVPNALAAAEVLAAEGIECSVLSMHTLKPIDAAAVLQAASETGLIITIEEHSIVGGLGSAVSEVLTEAGGLGARLSRLALPDAFSHLVGSQDYLRGAHGLSADGIAEHIKARLGSPWSIASGL